MTPLRALFALFDVDTGTATTKLKELNTSVDIAKQGLMTLAATALGAFSLHKVTSFIEEQIELGSVLNDTSEKLGISTDELQKFQFAAGLSGVGAEEAGRALQFLNKNMGEALSGNKEAVKQFTELGIATKDGQGKVRELGEVIPEVSDAFEKMGSDQERTAAAMNLFGKSGASLIPLLKEGSSKLKEMNEEFEALGLGINQDFIKAADDAGDRIDILKLGFRSLKTRIAVEVLPGITEMAKKLSGWVAWAIKVTRETNIVKYAWQGLALASAVAAGKVVHGWMKVLGLFPKNAGLLKNLFAMGEIGIIVGALLLIGLAIEDIVTMCQGGQSVIGAFLDEMLGVEYRQELVDTLNQAWADMQPAINELIPLVKSIGLAFVEVLPYAIALVVDLVKVVTGSVLAVTSLGKAIKDVVSGKSGGAIWDDLYKTSEQLFGKGDTGKGGLFSSSALADVLTAPGVPAGSVRQPGDFQRGDTTVSVTVNGGPSNADTGRAVSGAVQGALSSAERRTAAAALFQGDE